MSSKLRKLSLYDKRFILAILIVIGVFIYVMVITLVSSAKPDDVVTGILLSTGFATIVGFYYGSSDKKGKESSVEEVEKDKEE